MSDEYRDEEIENEFGDDEYEEIDSDEVDRVIETLEELIESVQSETIQDYLTEASTQIHEMFYGDEEAVEEEEEADAEADEDDEYEDDDLEEAA